MNDPSSGPRARPGAERRGELFWRGVRYFAAVGAGYMLGLAAGTLGGDGPGWPVVVLVSAVACVLIFRQGRKSNAHAAADAIAAMQATVSASSVAANQITVAGGDVLQGSGAGSLTLDGLCRLRDPDGAISARTVERLLLTEGSGDPVVGSDCWTAERSGDVEVRP